MPQEVREDNLPEVVPEQRVSGVAVGKLTELQRAFLALVTGPLLVAVVFLAFLFGSYFKLLPSPPPLSANREEMDNYKELRQAAKEDLKDNLEQIGVIFTPVFTALLGGLLGREYEKRARKE